MRSSCWASRRARAPHVHKALPRHRQARKAQDEAPRLGRQQAAVAAFAPVQIGPPAPVPPEVAIPRPTPAELEQVNAALKRFIDSDKSSVAAAAEEVRAADAAAAAARERRRHLHADQPAHGRAARRIRRDRQAGQHRPAPAWRLDHRLVAAGREQAGVRQVLRPHQDRQLRDCRRYDAGRPVGPAGTAKARDFSRRP